MPSQEMITVVASRKKRIRDIFQEIYCYTPLEQQIEGDPGEFQHQLKAYENLLIEEVNYLDIRYDHPLRAAEALFDLVKIPTMDHLHAFQAQATNSKFHPHVRAAVWGLMAGTFISLLTIAACTGVFALTLGLPFVALLTITAVPVGLMSLPVSSPMGALIGLRMRDGYAPVLNSVRSGNTLAGFFKPTPPAVAVHEMQPHQVASLPEAKPV